MVCVIKDYVPITEGLILTKMKKKNCFHIVEYNTELIVEVFLSKIIGVISLKKNYKILQWRNENLFHLKFFLKFHQSRNNISILN